MIKLLIYDLDGTLIDSSRDIANAVNWTLKELGFRELPLAQVTSYIGDGVQILMTRALEEVVGARHASPLQQAIKLFRARYGEHLLDETKLYPSVEEVLEHFRDRKQAVITNKPENFSRRILSDLGISSYFFQVIGGDHKFPKKPSPEAVLQTVKSAQIQLDETVLIGDSAVDIQTGKNAGIQTVGVTYGFGNHEELKHSQPDFIVHDLIELVTVPFFGDSHRFW